MLLDQILDELSDMKDVWKYDDMIAAIKKYKTTPSMKDVDDVLVIHSLLQNQYIIMDEFVVKHSLVQHSSQLTLDKNYKRILLKL
jgi:vacuolar-type H+-ATPase catalytic subunit A/Vma1